MQQRKDRIRVHVEGKEFNIEGGTFQEMLAVVKQINGRRFVGELKAWQLPGSAADVEQHLKSSGYQLTGGNPLAKEQAGGQPFSPPSGNDRIRVEIDGRRLAIVGGTFQNMLAMVKNLPNRRFDGDTKIWQITGEVGIIKGVAQAAGFTLEGAEDIPVAEVPPMETPDFGQSSAPPPPYEPPDFFNDAPPPPSDWFEEMPLDADFFPDDPIPFEAELPPFDAPPKPRPAPISAAPGGDRILIQVGEQTMAVVGGAFREMVDAVKQIPNRRFDGNTKIWQIPADVPLEQVQQTLQSAGFTLTADE